MIRPEHQFYIRPDLRKAASTKAESTTAESAIRPKQLVRHHVHEISVLLVSSHYFDTHFEIVVTNDYWNCVTPSEMKRKKNNQKTEFVLDSRFIH